MTSSTSWESKYEEELDRAFEELERQRVEEEDRLWREAKEIFRAEEEADEEEYCPCGHKYHDHYLGDGFCSLCECPGFGEPVTNWETFTATCVGDSPGGFMIYE